MFIGCSLNTVEMLILPKLILKFQCNTIQNLYICILCRDEPNKLILKYIWDVKGLRMGLGDRYLKKNKIKELLDFKTYYKVLVI